MTEGVVEAVEALVEAPAVPQKTGVGDRLRQAREARGMDADALAAALKLSRRQIEALEAGEWDRLPGHTFIRGFVRNYARVVQLDAEALLSALDAPVPAAPRLDLPRNAAAVMPEAGQPRKRDYAAVLAGFILMTLAVVAYYVVPKDLWMGAARTPEPTVAEKAEATPAFPPGVAPGTIIVPTDSVAAPGTAPSAVPVGDASVVPQPVESAAGGLQFSFAQPSWVEVRDRSGQVVFSQLNPAGSERRVDGQPPFALIVGNAGHVKVMYNGRGIDLQPRSKDDVARVTVE